MGGWNQNALPYSWLRRLERHHYQGQAFVHWVLTEQKRRTGWLDDLFHAQFREILTHTMFRYELCCPIYCCMPDHVHMVWVGLSEGSDQLVAQKFMRRHTNRILRESGFCWQKQSYDHVLRPRYRKGSAFYEVLEYIARNPERAGLVPQEGYLEYRYTDCLLPGFPEVHFRPPEYWARLERVVSSLRRDGLARLRGQDT